MLDVHGGLLAWTVITFVLLLVVLKKVAWGPILDALEARENEIKAVSYTHLTLPTNREV